MPGTPRTTKSQQRAKCAYQQVAELWLQYEAAGDDKESRQRVRKVCEEYKTAVRGLGANILRSGLSAALADLLRRGSKTKSLREHIADSGIPYLTLGRQREDELFTVANDLAVGPYMLATRETLEVVKWLKRATEALFDFPEVEATERSGEDANA